MKHFEQLWEEAEVISSSFCGNNANCAFENILLPCRILEAGYNYGFEYDDSIDTYNYMPNKDEEEKYIGQILFWLTAYSKIRNIDVYKLLSDQLEDAKTELLEQQLGGDIDDLKDQ
jgi:hypothetical protein